MNTSKYLFFQQKKSLLPICFFLAVFILIFAENAHAGYLDSGSGSSFIQGIVSIMAFFGRMVAKVKQLLGFGKK